MQTETRNTLISLLFLVVILVGVTTAIWLKRATEQATADLGVATTTRSATYTDMTGTSIALHDESVAYTVVLSWASWCPQCADLLPTFFTLADTYTDRNVRFIALNRSEPLGTIQSYVRATVPNTASSTVEILQDESDTFYDTMNGYSMPELVIFDKHFVPVSRATGADIDLNLQQYAEQYFPKFE